MTGTRKDLRSLERLGFAVLPGANREELFWDAEAEDCFSTPSRGNSCCAPWVGHSKPQGEASSCSRDSTRLCNVIQSSWSPYRQRTWRAKDLALPESMRIS